MVPLWLVLLVAVLLLLVFYLFWRLRQCKCGLLEGFETADDAKETEDDAKVDTKADTKANKAAAEDEAVDTDGKEAETVESESTDSAAATSKSTEKAKATDEASKDKKKPAEQASAAAAKKLTDQFMNYGEMKIFNSLRDNAYSLNDIKRMIREGEINEKMIEKFLARVEAMEVGSGASDASATKAAKPPVVEGFSPMGYASAMFN